MGFQFSFVAVFFIAVFAEHPKWKPGMRAWMQRMVRRTFRTALVAYVVATPMLAYTFGFFSLAAIPASLVLIVLIVPLLLVAMASLPVGVAMPIAGETMIKATIPFAHGIFRVLDIFGRTGAIAPAPAFSPYWLIPYYALLLLLWRPFVREP
ncbi:MAG TPA: ComEC/Rec2 family competence protein, partial [Fimbriimonadaceae bacterium]|nr:ComEC/Rec2 family competence protein [Fimbriimonadaceae bacterium]